MLTSQQISTDLEIATEEVAQSLAEPMANNG